MKRITTFLALLLATSQIAWAIPSEITYQGTLKEKGTPVDTTGKPPKTMNFRITNQDGTAVYWSSGDMQVDVHNGLFSRRLTPTGVDWQAVTPYMEVSVGGQALVPREPISASVYATISASIVDGAITPAKVAAGYGLVPAGAIMMFAAACPSGWTRFTNLDNKFAMGSDTYGVTGGTTTHVHTISPDGAHKHRLPIFSNAGESIIGVAYPGNDPFGIASGSDLTAEGTHPPSSTFNLMNPPANVALSDSAGSHDHGGQTKSANNLPPYMTLIFCEKN
jgi:hypothetical protein